MPLYEYECNGSAHIVITGVSQHEIPHEFTAQVSLADRRIMPSCPECGETEAVTKVIKTPMPKSKSWSV